MSHGVKLVTKEIRGRNIDLYVSQTGKFNADWDGDNYEAPTVDALVQKLTQITKVNLAIPFCRWDESKLKHGQITGLHGANKNILVRFDGEKGTRQEYHWPSQNPSKYLTLNPAEETEYVKLQQALEAATDAVEKFNKAHSFNAVKAIEKAIKETAA